MFANLGSQETYKTVSEELRAIIGAESLSADVQDLIKHSQCIYGNTLHGGSRANIIAFPKSTEDVSKIVKVAAKHNVPIIPYSGGTSVEGNTSAPHGGICLDFKFMSEIIEVRPTQLDVTVQPGVEWMGLNKALEPHGLFLPLDPAPGAKIGGMIATGCSGTNAARYGTIKDGWVLSLTVVLADGAIIRTKSRAKKSSAGYDITRWMIGSEGTLGITTEATLRLANIPTVSRAASCAFDSLEDIIEVASQMLRRGIDFQCIECVDAQYMSVMDTVQEQAGARRFPHKPHIFVKLQGNSAESVGTDGEILKQLCKNGRGFRLAEAGAETDALWMVRKSAPVVFSRYQRTETEPCNVATDVCVPLDQIAHIFRAHQADLDARGLRAALLGHVGDGNVHSLILLDKAVPEQVEAAEAAHTALVKMALEYGGTISGEHGVGTGKAQYLVLEHGERVVQLMKDIKKTLDPQGILNPGQIFAHDH